MLAGERKVGDVVFRNVGERIVGRRVEGDETGGRGDGTEGRGGVDDGGGLTEVEGGGDGGLRSIRLATVADFLPGGRCVGRGDTGRGEGIWLVRDRPGGWEAQPIRGKALTSVFERMLWRGEVEGWRVVKIAHDSIAW